MLLGAIGGLLAYDTQRNDGVFEKSAAGKFLKDTGALPYVEVAWTKSLSSSARGYQWAEVNVPIYANITYVALKPYGLFLQDLGIVGLNAAKNGWEVSKKYVAAKTPVVVNFVSMLAQLLNPIRFNSFRVDDLCAHEDSFLLLLCASAIQNIEQNYLLIGFDSRKYVSLFVLQHIFEVIPSRYL